MKSTRVPAQITTVEDKIVGNLSLSQMILLFVPIFIAGFTYIGMPPQYGNASYKVVLVLSVALVAGLSAIRIKGRILLAWAAVLLNYNLRPRYHILNKNDPYLRPTPKKEAPQKTEAAAELPQKEEQPFTPQLSVADVVQIEGILANPQAKLHFTNRKGRLYVRITEVK
jgi:hypothetical protein